MGIGSIWLILLLRVTISSSTGPLFTMVNTLQVLVCFGLTSLPMAPNVYVVLNDVTKLAGFELLPPEDVLAAMHLNFSETDPVNSGFYEMGVDSKTLIPNLGFFFIGILINLLAFALLVLLWALLKFRPTKTLAKICKGLRNCLMWSGVLVLLVEGFLAFSIGCGANLQQIVWEKFADFFNNLLVLLLTPVILIFPPLCYFFLRLVEDRMRYPIYKKKFGILTEELNIESPKLRRKATFVAPWFTIRRLLLAGLVLILRDTKFQVF